MTQNVQHDLGSASPSGGADPRSETIRVELDRIQRRWGELPLAQAQAALPPVRVLLDYLTSAAGQPPVPDLGPGTAVHQLAVLVWEASRRARHADDGGGAGGIRDIERELTTLRRDLP